MIELNEVYQGESPFCLKDIGTSSIDLVVTDPAYDSLKRWEGIGTTARMGLGAKGGPADDDTKNFDTIPDENLPDLIYEIHRVLKPNTHAYIMCDWITLRQLYYYAVTKGVFAPTAYSGRLFESCKPLIWDKVSIGTGYTYRQTYEFILMLWKGPKKRQLNDLSVPDILRFKKVSGKEKICPTQKPIGLFELLVKQSSDEGDIVLDPFMGSGTTGVASVRLGRRFIGFEIDDDMVNLAKHRINNENKKMSQTLW